MTTEHAEAARSRDRAATEARILAAARRLFAKDGYDRVTVRAIAAAADANPALISRYFGSKQELFGAALADAYRLERLLDGELADLPRRLAAFALRQENSADRAMLEALQRSAAVPELRGVATERTLRHFVAPLADRLPGPDGRTRALAATALLTGVGALRRSLGPRGLPSRTSSQEALDVLTATFAAALGLDPPPSPPSR